MRTSTSHQKSTTAFWRPSMVDVVSAVVLLNTARDLQSITITKLGSSGGFSVSSVTSESLEPVLQMSLFGRLLTSAIPLPGAPSGATS